MSVYIPRLTAPSTSDPRWIQVASSGWNRCIYGSDGPPSVLPNCTGYVHGRWLELSNMSEDSFGLSFGDASTYYTNSDSILVRGSTPKLGAVACWDIGGAGGTEGHVGIVEQILDNGDIVTSNSGWNYLYFYTQNLSKANNYNYNASHFQGFIYNPYIHIDPPGPVTPLRKKGYKFILFKKRRLIYGKR